MRKFLIPLSLLLIATSVFGAGDIDVLSMPSNVGFRFTCGKYYPGSGFAKVKEIADVNNDGIPDLAVSFPNLDYVSNVPNGYLSIIYGGANIPMNLDVCNFNDVSVGFRIKGQSGSNFGYPVASMGDLNGDLVGDLAIGATGYSSGMGRVYVVYLPPVSGRKIEYSIASLNAYSLTSSTGGTSATFGMYLTEAGDYNGDGLMDVLIGQSIASTESKAYILFGKNMGMGDTLTSSFTNSMGAVLTPGNVADTNFGRQQMAMCSDINGDGIPDYLIPSAANLYILYGLGKVPSSSAMVTNANGEVIPVSALSVLTIPATAGVVCADIDIDGRQDILVTLSDNNVHVLYGSTLKLLSSASIDTKTTMQGLILTQVVKSSSFGNMILKTSNWNGYGQDTVLISDSNRAFTYVLYASTMVGTLSGMNSIVIDNINTMQGFRIYSSDGTSMASSSIDASQDINGDGVKDVILSEATSYNSYVVYGQCNNPAAGCACPSGMRYKNGMCMNWGLSGGQKAGIIIGVVIGALLLIALGVLVLRKTSCCVNLFESYAKPQFSNTFAPIPQTQATSA